jgi:NitT/TauT family transport system substrate-binding protein
LFAFLAVLLALLPVLARGAEKPGQPFEKIRIAYSSISGNQVPAWIAYEKEFFRKNGLEVELVFIEGGARAVNALLSGDVAFSQMAGSSVLQSNLQGLDVVMIAGFLNTMDYQLVVHKSIIRPDQLKGKTMAVSRFGSSSDFATRYALDKYGLVPDKDVAILEIGSQPARFAALEAGKIQGAMVAVPLTLKAKKMGFHILADLQMLGLEYQHTGLATTQALIKSRPDLVRNIMKAYVEGIHYYKTHPREALIVLQKYLKVDDVEALAETYEVIGLTLIPERPYPTLRGIQIMLRELAAKEPKAKTARPEQFVDTRFVKELDSSGFIDRLYKVTPVVATGEAARSLPASVTVKEKVPQAKDRAKAEVASPAAKPALTMPPVSGQPQEYTVKAGDTLSHLALRFYGASHKWGKIYEANANALRNPHYIYVGQQLLIPAHDVPGT